MEAFVAAIVDSITIFTVDTFTIFTAGLVSLALTTVAIIRDVDATRSAPATSSGVRAN